MKIFKSLSIALLALTFGSGAVMAQAPAAPEQPKEGGQKVSVEERKNKMDQMQAKRDTMFKKRIEKLTQMMAEVEKKLTEGKINEKMKANMLERLKKQIENGEMILNEMKENQKTLEEHIKVVEETKVKANDLLSKLSSYTPPAKDAAAPAAPATPATPEKK